MVYKLFMGDIYIRNGVKTPKCPLKSCTKCGRIEQAFERPLSGVRTVKKTPKPCPQVLQTVFTGRSNCYRSNGPPQAFERSCKLWLRPVRTAAAHLETSFGKIGITFYYDVGLIRFKLRWKEDLKSYNFLVYDFSKFHFLLGQKWLSR